MTQKEAKRKVVEFMNRQMREYGLKPDMITGKTFAVVKIDKNRLDTIATNGFIGRGTFDNLAHNNA